jgi:hypothetical protein
MRAPDIRSEKGPWTTRLNDSMTRAQAAAQILLSTLDDANVLAALRGHWVRNSCQLDDYLLAPLSSTPPPSGKQMLLDFIDGKPVDPKDMRDLLQAVNQATVIYQRTFVDLPDDAPLQPCTTHDYYDLRTPPNGTSPYYVLHHPKRKDAEDNGEKLLSKEQREALGISVGMVQKSARIILGSLQSLDR